MKWEITKRCKFCFLSLLIMLYFIVMFPPVQYRKIGLMYGYSSFDEGEVYWTQLLLEVLIASFFTVIIYFLYPLRKKG
jgi:hypothetical protein